MTLPFTILTCLFVWLLWGFGGVALMIYNDPNAFRKKCYERKLEPADCFGATCLGPFTLLYALVWSGAKRVDSARVRKERRLAELAKQEREVDLILMEMR